MSRGSNKLNIQNQLKSDLLAGPNLCHLHHCAPCLEATRRQQPHQWHKAHKTQRQEKQKKRIKRRSKKKNTTKIKIKINKNNDYNNGDVRRRCRCRSRCRRCRWRWRLCDLVGFRALLLVARLEQVRAVPHLQFLTVPAVSESECVFHLWIAAGVLLIFYFNALQAAQNYR